MAERNRLSRQVENAYRLVRSRYLEFQIELTQQQIEKIREKSLRRRGKMEDKYLRQIDKLDKRIHKTKELVASNRPEHIKEKVTHIKSTVSSSTHEVVSVFEAGSRLATRGITLVIEGIYKTGKIIGRGVINISTAIMDRILYSSYDYDDDDFID